MQHYAAGANYYNPHLLSLARQRRLTPPIPAPPQTFPRFAAPNIFQPHSLPFPATLFCVAFTFGYLFTAFPAAVAALAFWPLGPGCRAFVP